MEVPRDRRSQAPHGLAIANLGQLCSMREFTPTYAATQPHYGTPPKTLPSSTLDLTDPVALPDADAATVLIFEQGLQPREAALRLTEGPGFYRG